MNTQQEVMARAFRDAMRAGIAAVHERHREAFRMVGAALRERLEKLAADRVIPPAQVVNELAVPVPEVVVENVVQAPVVNVTNDVTSPAVTVHVDMSPVAEAIDRALGRMVELTERLMAALSSWPPAPPPHTVEVRPNIHVEPAQVVIQPPPVPDPSSLFSQERPKRTIRIKHDDGTESVITEE